MEDGGVCASLLVTIMGSITHVVDKLHHRHGHAVFRSNMWHPHVLVVPCYGGGVD